MTLVRVDKTIQVPGALIVGAGIAGLFTALKLSPFPALILTGTKPGHSGSSAWAQGGIAAAIGKDDSWQSHMADTVKAGVGLCEPQVVEFVTREAAARIEDLVALGVPFDRTADGELALGREAAHSHPRIVHVGGDRAGAEVTRVLATQARVTRSIAFAEGFHAFELAVEDGRVSGVFARSGAYGSILFRSNAVILATGGIGALYAVTTNPPESSGHGLGMAACAGAVIADAEFVQFHPTAIAIGQDPAPLATEALRGEGATLINEAGHRFMLPVHPDAELAPRDVVARAIYREIVRGHPVFLDCRTAIGATFPARFPTVYAACRLAHIDPAIDPIPVTPAAHYHMGGIATDSAGRSTLIGLWAVGECASTGLHGANRLASNSLLEALVFGARTAQDVQLSIQTHPGTSQLPSAAVSATTIPLPSNLRQTMTSNVGLARDDTGLRKALAVIEDVENSAIPNPALRNVTAVAKLIAAAALNRRESRGSHFRADYPWSHSAERSRLTLADADRIVHDHALSNPTSIAT